MPAIVLTGLPGTGKTTLAQALAAKLKGHVLSKDSIRQAAFGPGQIEYGLAQDDLIQLWMEMAASSLWRRNPQLWVLFDGRTFSRRYQRAWLEELCRREKQKCYFLHLTAAESTVRERLAEPHPAANRDFALYKQLEAEFEEVTERPCLELASEQALERTTAWALTFLKAGGDS